jgi:hypothetical protein
MRFFADLFLVYIRPCFTTASVQGEVRPIVANPPQQSAIAIPADQLDAIMSAIAKHVGSAITGCASQRLLDLQGQSVDANAHIDWVDRQP